MDGVGLRLYSSLPVKAFHPPLSAIPVVVVTCTEAARGGDNPRLAGLSLGGLGATEHALDHPGVTAVSVAVAARLGGLGELTLGYGQWSHPSALQ